MTNIPILPTPPEDLQVCLPFIPYLIDDGEDDEEEVTLPRWSTMVRSVTGLFQGNSAPHSKSNMVNLRETLKGDWKADKRFKYSYPEIELEENNEETEDPAG